MTQHSPWCHPYCISGEQFRTALQSLGLWFDGNILSVKLAGRPDGYPMAGHRSSWYAEVEVTVPGSGGPFSGPYETRLVRVPIHTGPSEMDRLVQEFEQGKSRE